MTVALALEAAVALFIALVGALLREVAGLAGTALQARRSPLRRWFWEVCYAPGDTKWEEPDSIELVKVGRRGQNVRGKMYRVYPRKSNRDWAFSGELIGHRQLCLTYRSIGEDFASNGVMILGPLNRALWCGGFHEAPPPERDAELSRMAAKVGAVRRIGASVPEESHVEWLAANEDPEDPVRRFLASLPAGSPLAPARVMRQLPRGARRILREPPVRSRKARVLRALSRLAPSRSLRLRIYNARPARPAAWSSPTRAILFGDSDEDQAA